jgi:UDP-N-acetylglucosamine 2-epimerase (non-hydrolysing)
MVDTLLGNVDRARARPILSTLGFEPGAYGVVTLHRPANVDDDATLKGLLAALETIARDLPLILPAHPRTRRRLDEAGVPTGMRVTDPLGYLDFLALEADARIVLTDSGGVQEETTMLGVPCLTLRDNTERPMTVSEGTNVVVGRSPARIIAEARRVLESQTAHRHPPLWDGKAAERIADLLVAGGGPKGHLRPTDQPSAENRTAPS